MSKAQNGDGAIIKEMQELAEDLKRTEARLLSLQQLEKDDPARFDRNSDHKSPTALANALSSWEAILSNISPFKGALARASGHHADQDTNLEHTYFGQYRKRLSDGSVRTEPLDPEKFKKKLLEDMDPSSWTAADIVQYKERGQKTPPKFKECAKSVQIAWLLGKIDGVGEGQEVPDILVVRAPSGQTQVVLHERKSGRPATDEEIREASWGDNLQAVTMSVRSDFGGRDKVQKMMKKLGLDGKSLDATEEALRLVEAYRSSKLQKAVSSRRHLLVGGPGPAAASAITEILSDMGTKPAEPDVSRLRTLWPSLPRAADRLLHVMEEMRAGSVVRMSRRLAEMQRRCEDRAA